MYTPEGFGAFGRQTCWNVCRRRGSLLVKRSGRGLLCFTTSLEGPSHQGHAEVKRTSRITLMATQDYPDP